MVITTVFASSSAKASNVLTRLYALLESRPDVGSYRRKGLRRIEIITFSLILKKLEDYEEGTVVKSRTKTTLNYY